MSELTLDEYQASAAEFIKFKYADHPFLALGEEAGEVLGKLAKFGRKYNVPVIIAVEDAELPDTEYQVQLRADLIKELGDTLWQLSACAKMLGVSLSEIAQTNLDKLTDRNERGAIVGEGDNR